ncbi:MAG: DUF4175 family protein, partial [Lentimicrobium sp.]|nr:DUF4175 family protein [Lentimicrobium sp.]
MNDNYNILIDKLDAFIRKYYTNQLIRGGLYSIALLGTFFLVFTQLESLAWFSVSVRTVLFYGYLAGAAAILARFVILPLLKLNKAGKRISHEMAASIIGTHFSEVRDTLINTLQLNSLAEDNPDQKALIIAGINQKAEKLKPVPFVSAIDLSKNRKYLVFAAPPLLILLLFLFIAPRAITDPGNRLLNHSVTFEKPMPFSIAITNDELKAVQQEDFTLSVKVEGEELPDQVFIVIDGIEYRMEAEGKLNYTYTFKKVQKNQQFNFQAAGHYTSDYELIVLPKPIILNFDLELIYPPYTGQKTEILSNTGDVTVPQGTSVVWKFYTRDTKFLTLKTGESSQRIEVKNSNNISTSKRLMAPMPYSVSIENQFMKGSDSMSFFINVIPDLYPIISVDEYRDSVYDNRLYFKGLIKDDYGFNKMEFRLSRKVADGENSAETSIEVPIAKGNAQQQFYHFFDVAEAGLEPGDQVEYYFIVYDNDGVNGSKSSRSQKMSLKIPTRDEIEEMVQKNQDNVKSELEKSIEEARKIQKDISQLNKKLFDKKSLNYQEKKQVQELLDRQKNLQKQVEEMKLQNENANKKESQYSEINESIA